MSDAESEVGLRAGDSLGRWTLLAPLARGGMGVVWLARLSGEDTGERFAIKVIDRELAEKDRFERMFLDEARIATRLVHRNVVRTLELGAHEGVLYLVMEYVEGETLSRVRRDLGAKKQRMPLPIALRIVSEACAGLHAAHELRDERGKRLHVIHRDASPHNILVGTDGSVRVIDFGIARAKGRLTKATTLGELKGKLAYMAYEQVTGDDLDRRVDVWAMGACLHELVSGHAPFANAGTRESVARLLAKEPPRPLPDDVPKSVRAILAKSLVHDRDARFPTAEAMRKAIEAAIADMETPSPAAVRAMVLAACGDRIASRRELLSAKEILSASSAPVAKTLPGEEQAGEEPATGATGTTELPIRTASFREERLALRRRRDKRVGLAIALFAAFCIGLAVRARRKVVTPPAAPAVAPCKDSVTLDHACMDREPTGALKLDHASANAACAARGGRLPSEQEWERATHAPPEAGPEMGEWTSTIVGEGRVVRGPSFRVVMPPDTQSEVISFRCVIPR